VTDAFRCSVASLADEEPMVGTAPPESSWLFVEYAGSWAHAAVAESRMPDHVRAFLTGLDGIRVQLIRRHGRPPDGGVRVFTAVAGDAGCAVETVVLPDLDALVGLEVAALAAGDSPGLSTYDRPLWLVCTNGRRDVCCAERGRPVADALAARWPDATWETTHLGGHRFAGTLLALPSGLALGRLDPTSAVAACEAIEAGAWPVGRVRGRCGVSPAAQVAEHHVRTTNGLTRIDDVTAVRSGVGGVVLMAASDRWHVEVGSRPGRPRRQSCADDRAKPTEVFTVGEVTREAGSPAASYDG
jgi:hypothetical protein